MSIERILAPLKRRVMLMVGRCVLLAANDAPGRQEAQVRLLEDELRDGVERFQDYGFTSVPLPGAEGVAVFVGGNRDHGLIVAMDDRRYRIKGLEGGEVALYTCDDQDEAGHRIVFKRGGLIEVRGATIDIRASERLHLSGKEVEIHADERLETDTNGYGEAVNSSGGGYSIDSYRQGASPATTEHGIQPPEVE